MLTDAELLDILLQHEDLETALYTLIEQTNDHGGKDNVTVILVKVLAQNSKQAMGVIKKKGMSS